MSEKDLLNELHKIIDTIDIRIENKVNKSLVKHYGQKYQYLLTFFAAISVFLVINFFFARDLKSDLKEDMQSLKTEIKVDMQNLKVDMQNLKVDMQNLISMQYKNPDNATIKPQKTEGQPKKL